MKTDSFVIDAGVGKLVEKWLEEIGHTVYSIMSINNKMVDEDIINFAFERNAIIITMDSDFGTIVYKKGFKHSGILYLRLEEATGEEKLVSIQYLIPNCIDELKNNFCVYQNGKLRIRK
jgi:predicted nuclease of predicted toxin-antitoxin system